MTGKADFKWKNENRESFKEKETYLENIVYIFGSNDGDSVEIQAGFHSFSFSSALPFNIPSSFECKEGKISYKVEAFFVLPWKMNYLKGKTYLKVVSFVDLNIDAVLKLPFYTEISKNVRNFFFGSKALHMKVCTPFSGFIPGHKVKLIFDVSNKTVLNVSKTVIHLVQITKLTSGEHSKIDRTVILEVSALGTNKKSTNQFENDITIPMNLVPVKHSNIVNISYEIEIVAKLSSSPKKNPKFLIPIEIGTVPIKFERPNRCFGNLNLKPTTSFMSKYQLRFIFANNNNFFQFFRNAKCSYCTIDTIWFHFE
jgi:Arrestin (or S-antigen), N-terminal domain/Arrestin (or S-antigen), C-terminal domain